MPAVAEADYRFMVAVELENRRRLRGTQPTGWRQSQARAEQLVPGWLRRVVFMGGAGSGKTRAGAEWIKELVAAGCKRIICVGATHQDWYKTMLFGESGILAVSEPDNMPVFKHSDSTLTWPNGAQAHMYSAEDPRRLRGPQCQALWADEVSWWQYEDAWIQADMRCRLKPNYGVMVTMTPRPCPLVFGLVGKRSEREVLAHYWPAEEGEEPVPRMWRHRRNLVVTCNTFENAPNLDADTVEGYREQYEGTTLGRQELYAELLEEIPGALWKLSLIDPYRMTPDRMPELARVVVAIDPAATANKATSETGIIVAGRGYDHHGYVLEDRSGHYSPRDWALAAKSALREFQADRIVAEVNQGGEMVEATLRSVDKHLPYRAVRATRGKRRRAEPIAALYEQGKVHHVLDAGRPKRFDELEKQMCEFTHEAPASMKLDRMDALVWALTAVMLDGGGGGQIIV
jgi:phage terminase large subunit-like protein